MKAIIMAAGYGTRLEPLTLAVPKPMVTIVNRPVMEHNLLLLKRYGFKNITANVHYFPEQIENFFGNGKKLGINLSYSYEKDLLGTAGGVRRMAKDISKINKTFVVLSSDALTDINLSNIIKYHKKKKAVVTIALLKVEDTSQFGVVILDKSNRITAFQEKPKPGKALSNLVNTGIYVFEPEILDMIPKDKFFDFAKDLFPRLIEQNIPIYGYPMVEYWSDIGNLKSYLNANLDVLRKIVRVDIPYKKVGSSIWVGKDTTIDKTAKFEGTVIIGNGTEVRRGAYLKDVVIGDMSVISHDTRIEKSVLWKESFISRTSQIYESVIGSFCQTGKGSVIKQSIISNCCKISSRRVISSMKVLPNTSI
jgi:NDP-sugar pyrophosphorylase family protein